MPEGTSRPAHSSAVTRTVENDGLAFVFQLPSAVCRPNRGAKSFLEAYSDIIQPIPQSSPLLKADHVVCGLCQKVVSLKAHNWLIHCAASSAASERAFSVSGRIMSDMRRSLKPESLSALVMIAANRDLLSHNSEG